MLYKAEIDRAVLFALMEKVWGLIAVPVNFLLIAKYFSPELQGYYYTFASLISFQFLIELGLGNVIMQFAGHEWSGLSLNEKGHIHGDSAKLSRLQSLAQFAFRWYGVASLLLMAGLMAGGYLFFSNSRAGNINWMFPWLALSVLNAAVFCLVPLFSLIEGCNQVKQLYAYRLFQGVCSSCAVWIAIFFGAGLWTSAIATLTALSCSVVFLIFRYAPFFKTLLFSPPDSQRVDWKTEIWPLQWRVTITWLIGSFSTNLFVPVLFYYHGAVIAGQTGMTLSLIGVLSAIASAWIYPRVPFFCILISQRKYVELDQLFWRITKIVAVVTVIAAVAILIMLYGLDIMNHPLSARFLPLLPSMLFLATVVLINISTPMASYLRAHKREPLLFISVISGLLLGLSVLVVGKYYSATGIGICYLLVNLILFPFVVLVWQRCRKEWHSDKQVN